MSRHPSKRFLLVAVVLVWWLVLAVARGQEEADVGDLAEAEARLYSTAGEVRFENGRDALDIPFEINSDKIYLQVRINGKGPFWMILDTGSPGLVLDTATAKELELAEGATGETTGAGESAFPITAVEGTVNVGLPGLELFGQNAAIGPLDEVVGPFEGRKLEGALGCYNLLTRFEVEIDYERRRLHIRPFGDGDPGEGALEVPVNTEYGHPMAEGSLLPQQGDAVPGTFLIDTGMRGSLLLPTPYVDGHSLIERSGRTVYVTSGGGIGGQVFTHLGRLQSLSFGEVTVEGVPVNMSQVTEGLLAEPWEGGIIGSDVLQRFRVIFDYANDRLLLHPRAFHADDLDVEKSGLFLVSKVGDRSAVKVLHVAEGSVAAAAGVQVGDLVRGVNGRPASDFTLEALRGLLRQPVGTGILLTLERSGEPVEARFDLRPLI